jgi:hypothetical protein
MTALAAAMLDLPYGYYVLLRLLVCGVCAYLAVRDAEVGKRGRAWILAGFAVLYNPIIKLPVGKEIWPVVNGVTIAVLALHMWSARGSEPPDQKVDGTSTSGSGP